MVGLLAHFGGESAERRRGAHDGQRATVEFARVRRADDLGFHDAPQRIHRHVHRELAVQLLATMLREVARAALFDLAPQAVVVDGVDLLARRRADVALLRARVLLVDALFDLGKQLDQLASPLFVLALLRRALIATGVGRGQHRHLATDLREQLLLLLLQLLDLLALILVGIADFDQCADGGSGEVARPRCASPPPARLACAIACALVGGSPEREFTRITSSGVS